MDRIEQLTQQAAQINGDIEAKQAAIAAENRAAKPEELTALSDLNAQFDNVAAEIALLKKNAGRAALLSQPGQRISEPAPNPVNATPAPVAGATTITGGNRVAHNYANHGFDKGVGQFFMAVRSASLHGKVDERLLVNSVASWAGESVGADGGFALPPQFTQGIMSLVTPQGSFIQALNPFPTQSDIITVPKDEDAPWSTTAITAAKTAEGTAITASKPSIGQLKVPMYGVKSLVHVDEKSLRDMAFLGAYVERKMAEKIRWKVENYVMNGTGENEPLGIVNAPGLLSIAASDGTSTASLFSAYDIGLMEASCLKGSGACFWVGHPLVKAQLRTLTIGTAGFPLIQSDFRNGQQIDTLLGYPYYTSEAAKAYGNPCDLTFVCTDGYLLAFEAAGPQTATTIAFAFDQNLQSFRSTLYMGGAPTLSAVVTRADGSSKASNLVTLAGSRS